MNTKHKSNTKFIKTITTMILVVVFQIVQMFSPFAIFVNASSTQEVSVIVVDYDTGKPIQGANVTFYPPGNSYQDVTQTSGTDGTFKAVLHNGKNTIIASKSGYTDYWPKTYVVNEPNSNLTIRLKKQTITSTSVGIDVIDSTGGVGQRYDTNNQNPQTNRYDYFIKDNYNRDYKLLGDTYADIKIAGNQANFFQYEFVKSDINPVNLPQDNWIDVNINNQEINDDVDVANVGNLTQRSYDVSDLPTLKGNEQWSNADLVFKYPFEATSYKSTGYSNTASEYGHLENYVKYDNTTEQRWVTNTVFLSNSMFISNNYKEASKFWGYLKVPQDGSYYFGGWSDDGCRADITIDGKTYRFIDMFQPQESTFGSNNAKYTLKADWYYPIYMEYFNWGGSADFRLQYKNNSGNAWKNIPNLWFYPSKSSIPGENANNGFGGITGVKMPDEIGKYYIAYRTGIRDANKIITEIQKSGFYGPFVRDERFVLSRTLNNNGADKIGDEFEINYTVTPNDIPVTDVYKNYQAGGAVIPKAQLEISNIRIQDVLPSGLIYSGASNNATIVNNSNEVSGNINEKIIYNLTSLTYHANPVTIIIKVKPAIEGTYNLLKKDSILTYTDISIDDQLRAQRYCNFPDFSFNVNSNSGIATHGIYYRSSNTIKTTDLNVVNKVPTEIAMIINVNSPYSVINWTIDKAKISDKKVVFKKYEVLNGNIDKSSLQTLTLDISNDNGGNIQNGSEFEMKKGSVYIIIYTITPNGNIGDNIGISAKVANTNNSKPLTLTIKSMPDLI